MIVFMQGSEISGEDQGSQEDFEKTIKELESQHFVVQCDKLKVCTHTLF